MLRASDFHAFELSELKQSLDYIKSKYLLKKWTRGLGQMPQVIK